LGKHSLLLRVIFLKFEPKSGVCLPNGSDQERFDILGLLERKDRDPALTRIETWEWFGKSA
jgi:hypothetical protein